MVVNLVYCVDPETEPDADNPVEYDHPAVLVVQIPGSSVFPKGDESPMDDIRIGVIESLMN